MVGVIRLKYLFSVLCIILFTSVSYAETIRCVDTNNKEHFVKFIEDNIDFTYVDGVQYVLAGEDQDSSTVFYKSNNKELIFFIDVNNRDWFHLLQATISTKKDEKQVDYFYAKCDNVNLVK